MIRVFLSLPKGKKRALLWLLLLLALLLAAVITKAFYPRSVVEDPATAHIVRVEYNPFLGKEDSELFDLGQYDAAQMLHYLATCEEQRTLETSRVYWQGNVEFAITMRTETGMRQVLLGNVNYSYGGYGSADYSIKDAERVLETLLSMVNTSSIVTPAQG